MRTLFAIALCIVLTSCENNAQDKVELKSDIDSVSYAIGMQIGQSFKQQEIEVNLDILKSAITHSINDTNLALTQEQTMAVMMKFQQQMQMNMEEKQKKAGEENLSEGQKFLEENKAKEGVKVTESGLQYKVLKQGDGPVPSKDDKVSVHYTGKLLSGKVFDSSVERGQPATFPVTGVIPGWVEALQMMPVGSKWELYIPPDLGYGERGAGADIGPNAVLIFEVELLGIEGK